MIPLVIGGSRIAQWLEHDATNSGNNDRDKNNRRCVVLDYSVDRPKITSKIQRQSRPKAALQDQRQGSGGEHQEACEDEDVQNSCKPVPRLFPLPQPELEGSREPFWYTIEAGITRGVDQGY